MNSRGFILYEALIIFMIISTIVISCSTLIDKVRNHNQKIEKVIDKKEKEHNIDYKKCDYNCLIKKGIFP